MIPVEGYEPWLLFVDTEAKPGHWIGGDYVSKLITAIAWSWDDPDRIEEIDHYDYSLHDMLSIFRDEYDRADLIIGHYERGFDLPLLNHCAEREGMPPFLPKLTIDTKLDRLKTHGGSQSQKNLAAQYGLMAPKIDVTLRGWEGFNDREPGYRDAVVERVTGDVRQLMELYHALDKAGYLGRPRQMSYRPGNNRRYSG